MLPPVAWFAAAITLLAGATTSVSATSYMVASIADNISVDGVTTLREAVQAASTNTAVGDAPAGTATGDTITFSPGLSGMTIPLTLGPLVVTDDLTITGLAAHDPTIDGGGSRVFTIGVGAETVSIANLTMTNGADTNGGAILVAAGQTLNLASCTVSMSAATESGGGIWNGGSLVVTGCTIEGNSASGAGVSLGGGGLYNEGDMTVVDSVVASNMADGVQGVGGGIFNQVGGTLVVDATQVGDNWAATEGGGLWNSAPATMTVQNGSMIDGNTASGPLVGQGGGGLYNEGHLTVTGSLVSNNVADGAAGSGGGLLGEQGGISVVVDSTFSGNSSMGVGGGIENNEGSMSLTDVSLSMNSTGAAPGNGGGLHVTGSGTVNMIGGTITGNIAAAEGGGIWNSADGSMSLSNVVIDGNTASGDGTLGVQGGGGAFNDGGSLIMGSSTVSNNAVNGAQGSGGGLLNEAGGFVLIVRTTISGNTSLHTAGGIMTLDDGNLQLIGSTVSSNIAADDGGGIRAQGGAVEMTNVTVFGNSAAEGGGIHEVGASVRAGNTIIAGNSATVGPDYSGLLNSEDYNLISTTAGAVIVGETSNNLLDLAALLGPLQDSGGPTATHLPLTGSRIIDAGSGLLAKASGLTSDQRGLPRTVDVIDVPNATDGTDIGAVEEQDAGSVVEVPTLGRFGIALLVLGLLAAALGVMRRDTGVTG